MKFGIFCSMDRKIWNELRSPHPLVRGQQPAVAVHVERQSGGHKVRKAGRGYGDRAKAPTCNAGKMEQTADVLRYSPLHASHTGPHRRPGRREGRLRDAHKRLSQTLRWSYAVQRRSIPQRKRSPRVAGQTARQNGGGSADAGCARPADDLGVVGGVAGKAARRGRCSTWSLPSGRPMDGQRRRWPRASAAVACSRWAR